jgi:hypothetical protein
MSRTLIILAVLAALGSRAALAQSERVTPGPEARCSFRSPTTCWNVWGGHRVAADRSPKKPPVRTASPPATVLVLRPKLRDSVPDSTGSQIRPEGNNRIWPVRQGTIVIH